MSTRSVGLLTMVWLALSVSTSGAVRADGPEGARIDEFVRAEMARQKVPGVAIAVVRKGEILKAQGYGYANVEHEVPVTTQTIFQSGSLGKMFTAVGVMLQVEDGKLSLSDPITKFFPDAPKGWQGITVRHLLTHTSGIADYADDTLDVRKDRTEDELVHYTLTMPLEFPAGTRWNYSNSGYLLLGAIVRKVSGRFYGDVLTDRVFRPLGMKTTRVISEADIVPHRAAGYQLVKGELKNQDWVAPSLNTTADGALYFCIDDLIAWDKGVRARALLRPESWNTILTPVRLASGKNYPYGFGWGIEERAGAPLQEHGGSWQGFRTQYSRFLGEDLSVIVLTNLAEADPEKFADGIAAVLQPKLAVPALAAIEDRDPQMTRKAARLLDDARAGKLAKADFAYVRAGFFPESAKDIQTRLTALGAAPRLVLVKKEELGDDRIFTYEVPFQSKTMYYTVGFAPDERVSTFRLWEK